MNILEFKAYFEELKERGEITSYKYENETITYRKDPNPTLDYSSNGAWVYSGDISLVDGRVRVSEIAELIHVINQPGKRMYTTTYALTDDLCGFEIIRYKSELPYLNSLCALLKPQALNRFRGKISIPDAYKEGLIDKKWLDENLECYYGDQHESLIEVLEMYKEGEIFEITEADAQELEGVALLDLTTLERGRSMLDDQSIPELAEFVLPSGLRGTSKMVAEVLRREDEIQK